MDCMIIFSCSLIQIILLVLDLLFFYFYQSISILETIHTEPSMDSLKKK